MKIICYKLFKEQIQKIDELIEEKKLYFSRSEFLRFTSQYLIQSIEDGSYTIPNFQKQKKFDKDFFSHNVLSAKESISSKFTEEWLSRIDNMVSSNSFFESRSHFFRESIPLFLEDHKTLWEQSYLRDYKKITVAFKLQPTYRELIENHSAKGLNTCLSESVREFVYDFLQYLQMINSNGGKMISIVSEETEEQRKAVSIKFPKGLISMMDHFVDLFSFQDRSKFIRQAILFRI